MAFSWSIKGDKLVMTTSGWTEDEIRGLDYGIQLALGEIEWDDIPEDDADNLDIPDARNLMDLEYEMLPEDLFTVYPEHAGALTDSLLLSTNCTFEPNDSEDPEDMSECDLFWFPDYQVRSYLEDLVEKGEAVWESS